MFPFLPDTLEIESFQSFTYQIVNINACYRYELEALPFLTPSQIDIILSRRPYKDWEDLLRKTNLKEYELEYLKNFVYFGRERYHKTFLKVGSSGVRFSSSGRNESLSYSFYLGRDTSFFFSNEGFFRIFFGNSKVFSPLGFAGYGGYYSNNAGMGFSYNSSPSLGFSLGKFFVKYSVSGIIGGYLGERGGVFLSRSEVSGGISYINYGPFSLEGALSRNAFGFGVKGYSREGGFFIRIFNGKPFWYEGNQRTRFSLWYRWKFADFRVGFRISSEDRKFYFNFLKEKGSLKVEYFQVPRLSISYGNLLAGVCKGCTFIGVSHRKFWLRLYSFTESGLKFYEDAHSSRVFTSKVGYRISLGLKYKNFGSYVSYDGRNTMWEGWLFTTLR